MKKKNKYIPQFICKPFISAAPHSVLIPAYKIIYCITFGALFILTACFVFAHLFTSFFFGSVVDDAWMHDVHTLVHDAWRVHCASCLWFFEHLTCFTYAIYWSRYILLFSYLSLSLALSSRHTHTLLWQAPFTRVVLCVCILLFSRPHFHFKFHFVSMSTVIASLHFSKCRKMRMRTTQSVWERVSEDEKRLCHFLPCRFLPPFVHFFSLVMVGVDVVVVAVVTTRCHLFRLHPFKMLMHEFTSSIAFSQRSCVCWGLWRWCIFPYFLFALLPVQNW